MMWKQLEKWVFFKEQEEKGGRGKSEKFGV